MLRILRDIGLVFDYVFVATCDAEAMCPNFNTDEGLGLMMAVLDAFIFKVKPGWPRNQLFLAIRLLLKFNVFQFDYACFR